MLLRLITLFFVSASSLFAGLIDELPETEQKALDLANKVICYKETESIKLNMHIFLPKDIQAGDKRPAMLFIHGGGWRGGTPAVHAFESLYFSKRGIVTFTISYRLLGKGAKTPADCLEDARDALKFIRKNAEKFNIDPTRILTSGGSAGGHLASALSTINDSNWSEKDYPNAMILLYPAFDLENGWKGGRSSCLKAGIDPIKFSPAHNINDKTPPTLILSGSKDTVVNPECVRTFTSRLNSLKSKCRYIEYDGKGHKLFERNKNDVHFRATIHYMESFLKELGWLKQVLSSKTDIKHKIFE